MFRPNLELADIFRRHGEAWRSANAGHVNLVQRRVMTAIEICRTAALGGHVERCRDCAHTIGVIAVLHTWGQNLHHHPHLHCVVPGGGVSPDGKRWIASKPGFFLPVRVLSRLFRRLFLEGLTAAFEAGKLQCFTDLVRLNEAKTFAATLAPLRTTEWVVYAKKTFAGREQLLAYLARYTHRVAITNTRLLDVDETHVRFRWKNHRQRGGHKNKVMRITIAEFIRRFLLHVLPDGFHRIRHYGLLANGHRADQLALCRSLLAVRSTPVDCNNNSDNGPSCTDHEAPPCPCCGGRMAIIEIFEGSLYRPYPVRKLDGL